MKANPASVIKVGDGRGFIIERHVRIFPVDIPLKLRVRRRHVPGHFVSDRVIVTAAHCLLKLPSTIATENPERVYPKLLGRLDGSEIDVWAECLFADPVADIAVLGCPDSQQLPDKADAYDALVDAVPAMGIGNARSGRGWVLALSGDRWIRTPLKVFSGLWGTRLQTGPIEAGMSGSPILNDAGQAVGVVAISIKIGSREDNPGWQPMLTLDLPGRLLLGNRRR